MKIVWLPIFLLRLGLINAWSWLKITWQHLNHLSSFVLSVALVMLVIGVIFPQTYLAKVWPQLLLSPTLPEIKTLSEAEEIYYENQVAYWLDWQAKQPHHRDVLLNLARLYQVLDNQAEAQKYWSQARALDPNHPAFTQAVQ